MIAVKLTT